MAGLYSYLYNDQKAPEFITVGISYTGFDEGSNYERIRCDEYLSVKEMDCGGRASEFLSVLEKQIFPYVESELKGDPSYRVIAAPSLAATFALYSLFQKPALFQGYILVTPDVLSGKNWAFAAEKTFAATNRTLKARMHISIGADDNPTLNGAIRRFSDQLAARRYKLFEQKFQIIEAEGHISLTPEALMRGVAFTFAPLVKSSQK